jgi:predicted GTPase
VSLVNDYFLLYHGVSDEQKSQTCSHLKKEDSQDFYEISALVLSTTRRNFSHYIILNSFQQLINRISQQELKTIEELYTLQHCIINHIEHNTTAFEMKLLHDGFQYLQDADILYESQYKKLLSLFDPEELVEQIDEIDVSGELNIDENSTFQKQKKELDELIQELKNINESKDFIEELEKVQEYLANQKFSIGITGVMNAGKSTMLNALMGEEILGSAVVPETANLTIVKYGTPKAKVFYWNKAEWKKIQNSAQELTSIKEFVEETKNAFKDELQNYILEKSYTKVVDVNELASYTSAGKSDKKCNLVKYVELKSQLEFLKDGIEIVDTPGLDDPVLQREEITKEYISQCDFMMHLMNVSQSATLKDVEFIIDALLYQNVTNLLIVITRADTVSKSELEEAINYTRASIKAQLKEQNKDSKLDFVLKNIRFIPISGKMALLHRTNKAQMAIEQGFDIEDTGVLQIEEYINDTLFGKSSSKSALIIQSAKKQLTKTIERQLISLRYELVLLSKSKEELEEEIKQFKQKKDSKVAILKTIKEDIEFYKVEAEEYILKLEGFLSTELLDLKNIIRQRVFNDVKYSFEKTKKRPTSSRIKTIIQTAIKDGLIDILRDYRYKFIKKSQELGEICEQKYKELDLVVGYDNENFDAQKLFKDDFKSGFLLSSNEILISKIQKEVSNTKSKKLDQFNELLIKHINDEFTSIEQNLKPKANLVSIDLIQRFFQKITKPIETLEEQLRKDEALLQKMFNEFDNNEQDKEVQSFYINKKIKKFESIQKGLK